MENEERVARERARELATCTWTDGETVHRRDVRCR